MNQPVVLLISNGMQKWRARCGLYHYSLKAYVCYYLVCACTCTCICVCRHWWILVSGRRKLQNTC